MSFQTQIHDSRANGTKSHRPKTPEGTARSAQNSVRHGILADSLLLDEESSDRFQSLFQSFQCIFSRVDEFETVCVETMIAARWRCMRVWAVEPAGLQHAVKSQPDEGLKGSTRASIAVRSQFEGSNERDVLERYETRYDRQFSGAYGLLLKYRAANGGPCDSLPDPQVLDPKTLDPPNIKLQNDPTVRIAWLTGWRIRGRSRTGWFRR